MSRARSIWPRCRAPAPPGSRFETVATANATDSAIAWVAAPVTRELLAQREKIATSARFIWEDDAIDARPAFVTTNCPSASLICADFTKLVVGEFFSGLELAINPSAGFNTGQLTMRAFLVVDCAIVHPTAFIVAATVT